MYRNSCHHHFIIIALWNCVGEILAGNSGTWIKAFEKAISGTKPWSYLLEVTETVSFANMLKVSNDLHVLPWPPTYILTESKLWERNTWGKVGEQREGYHHCQSSEFLPIPGFLARGIQNGDQYSCCKLKTSSSSCLFQFLVFCCHYGSLLPLE